jgi:hypothetical protein
VKTSFINKNKTSIIGIAVGAIAGWAYYYFIGCNSGSCVIASNAEVAIPYGAVIGFLFAGIIKK